MKAEHKEANEKSYPGYPKYPAEEDIYRQEEKQPYTGEGLEAEEEDQSSPGADLDVPGAELDDAGEATGNEDEENNYYSLGGDRHEEPDAS